MKVKYEIKTELYGRMEMPAVFQKTTDNTLIALKNTYCFLNDIFLDNGER